VTVLRRNSQPARTFKEHSMRNLSASSRQLLIGAVLVALMVVSRGHYFPALRAALPSTSWAVFFLAGLYLQPRWFLAALLLLAGVLDVLAIGWGNVSDYCMTIAYAALLPAYAALWLGGRWFANEVAQGRGTMVRLAATAFTATLGCEIISSGSFYFSSGRFADPTLAGFGERLVQYFPHSLAAMAVWVALAVLVRAALQSRRPGHALS
jgi:hypothetical protein